MGEKGRKAREVVQTVGKIGWIGINVLLGMMAGLCAQGEIFWEKALGVRKSMVAAKLHGGNEI